MPKLSLPVRLVLLVAGTTLPLIIFAVGLVFYNYEQDRRAATQRVLETVRSIRLVLDAEMQRMTGGLRVMALTNALRDRDFDGFRPIATSFLERYGKEGVVLVADRDGRQLFSSVTADTASLPPRNHRDVVEKAFATKSTQYSSLFIDEVKKRLIVTIEVPVLRDGEVVSVLSFSPPIEIFQALIEKQRPSQAWTISIFDRDSINFARVPNPQETVGKRASPTLYAAMQRAPETTVPTVSLEGVPLITSFARSSLTGWTVAAGIAESSLVGPLLRNLAITSVIGGLLLLIGLAFAVRMARAIARGEMLHDLLIEELNHRVKNTLAILQAIATQTFRSASRVEREKFEGRLGALAEAHNLLSKEKWEGSELKDVVGRVLQPYLLSTPERLRISGPNVPLSPRLAVVLSMILHEI
ncbi:MAG: HWE histidine kinase domain-containing protein, partial [Bradyrhizobium sp.]|nr:HWE histidine kinase domain-containing protein [Bradyrhizobium sp.]